jgi:hypothetical protein
MGHQISAYKSTDIQKEVAYLGRSACDPHRSQMYFALNCLEFYAGSNGIGAERTFTRQEMLAAMDYLKSIEELDEEREFVSSCLDNMEEEGIILISFY